MVDTTRGRLVTGFRCKYTLARVISYNKLLRHSPMGGAIFYTYYAEESQVSQE